jgi:hypothetical protein
MCTYHVQTHTYKHITLRFLIDQDDMDINVQNSDGNTPLHIALESVQETISMLLIHHGADVSVANNVGRTPLHFAALQGMDQVCMYVCMCVCVCACYVCVYNISMLLIHHGADVSVQTMLEGHLYTLLHCKAWIRYVCICVCVCVHICVCARMCMCVFYACVHTYMHIQTHAGGSIHAPEQIPENPFESVYIYIYVCVCVCVCVYATSDRGHTQVIALLITHTHTHTHRWFDTCSRTRQQSRFPT